MVVAMEPSAERSNGAFFILHGHCFRILKSRNGHAMHCDAPVAWKGPWRDVKGEVWIVEACDIHRPDIGPSAAAPATPRDTERTSG
jgi:hypothetical protein